MQKRQLTKTNLETSLLGMGCMRMPADGDGKLLLQDAVALIRHAIDGGISYIDTAYNYHRKESEIAVGMALQDGYRERVILTTKLPGWEVETEDDFDRILNEQLTKLQTDHVDYYLVHSLYSDLWQKLGKLNVLAFLDRAKADGRIRYAGFSFHDELPVFKTILNAYDWDVCQVQYNLLDVNYQAGQEGIRLAKEAGIDVIVMEPLRGGRLADKIPADIRAVWEAAPQKRSPVEWAFRFVADRPEVKVILSGMNTKEQIDDNLQIFDRLTPLTEKDLAVIKEVQTLYRSKIKIGCTGCEYCLPCPEGVSIPRILELYNNITLFDDLEGSRKAYAELMAKGTDQSACIACGICESKCPQNLAIIEGLAAAHAVLS